MKQLHVKYIAVMEKFPVYHSVPFCSLFFTGTFRKDDHVPYNVIVNT